MTNIEQVAECIEASPGGICDACISNATAVRPHQQVNQICRRLADQGLTNRSNGICERCSRKLVINTSWVPSPSRDTTRPTRSLPETDAVTPADLDELRRFVIRQLNAIDPGNTREGFTGRIVRLRDAGAIPWNIASLALTHSSYRNKVHHEAFVMGARESQILRLIGDFLRDYFKQGNPA